MSNKKISNKIKNKLLKKLLADMHLKIVKLLFIL